MDPKGTIGLDETLDLAFDLKLSSRLTDKAMMKSNIAKFIKNDQGWGVIPLKIYGTFSEPSYAVDMEKTGKRVIRKEADKFLDKIFDKNEIKELEPVKDLLKGLFR
jgi:AsmA protein